MKISSSVSIFKSVKIIDHEMGIWQNNNITFSVSFWSNLLSISFLTILVTILYLQFYFSSIIFSNLDLLVLLLSLAILKFQFTNVWILRASILHTKIIPYYRLIIL